jgi:hypothetical protein
MLETVGPLKMFFGKSGKNFSRAHPPSPADTPSREIMAPHNPVDI